MRLFEVFNPLMEAISRTNRPDKVWSGLVYDEKTKTWVIVMKAAYQVKADAEKFLALDSMIDKV